MVGGKGGGAQRRRRQAATSVRCVIGPLAPVPVPQALLAARVRVPVGLRARGRVRLRGRSSRRGGRPRRRRRVALLLRLRRRLGLTAAVWRLTARERAAAGAPAAADPGRLRLALLVPRQPAAERHTRGRYERDEDAEPATDVNPRQIAGALVRDREDA